jgi:predicted AlkP superfamily pyrophosphatase or phosphodiesterase
MKLRYFILCMFWFISGSEAQSRVKKAIFIIADGIPADVIEKSEVPSLRKIMAAGGYTRAHVGGEKGGYSQTPTISANGYNCLLTGTWANKHNVWDNDIKDPDYHYWNIFQILKTQAPGKKIGIFSTWTDNRTKLAHLPFDYSDDGYELDTARFPHDEESRYIHQIDEKVTVGAADCIRSKGPDLSWVYLEYTDDMGHRYGDSKQMDSAVSYMDAQVGRIWEAIEYREKNFTEDWLIIITTDHGREPQTGKGHGGQSDRERTTWIITNGKTLNSYFHDPGVAIVDILPSILYFMNLPIPRKQAMELDGVSFLGPISISSPTAFCEKDSIRVNWKARDGQGDVKIWLSTSNHFKEGGVDKYRLVGQSPLNGESFTFSIKNDPSLFYKIVIESSVNFLNRWIILKEN